VSRGWKTTVIVVAVVLVVSTPLLWLLDGPNAGQLTGATVQAAAGVAALVWALFQQAAHRADDSATGTGDAEATAGGTARTGVTRPGGRGSGSAKAENTGRARADGAGSSASTGVDYS
jgi:hypothetical protein